VTIRHHTDGKPAGNDSRTEPASSLVEQMEALTAAVFQSGMSAAVVMAKWDGIAATFAGFDPVKIASMTPDDVDRLIGDPRVIRNRRKIEATVENASRLLDLESRFEFADWVGSHGDLEATVRAVSGEFAMVGPHGARLFLQKTGHAEAEIGGGCS
jgi:DNA-3-methyladenine glycosylase I